MHNTTKLFKSFIATFFFLVGLGILFVVRGSIGILGWFLMGIAFVVGVFFSLYYFLQTRRKRTSR